MSLKMFLLHLLNNKSSLPPITDKQHGMVNSGTDKIYDIGIGASIAKLVDILKEIMENYMLRFC